MKANKLVLAWKSIKAFAKRNAFSCACFLLALVVLVTGSVSYAKYVNGNSQDGSASAGSFSASATIDSVTALSFTNTAFWGESDSGEENDVAMNALRSINFSVNNFKGTGSDQVVSSVRTKYVLSFSAPKNFMEQLALQVLTEQGTAQLPQIVVADLISAGNNNKQYNTADSIDYNSATFDDLTFTVTKSGNNYTATSEATTVTLEAFTKQVEQSLDFRMWDTSKLTSEDHKTLESEGGELLPSLTATYSQDVNYYRITISIGAFVLPAGTPTTVKHIVQLAPINVLTDEHIGGTFVTLQKDDAGNIIGFAPITEIYGDTSAPQFTLMRVSESSTGTFYTDNTFTTQDNTKTAETEASHVLTGTPVTYTANGVYTSSSKTTEQVNETTNGGTYTVTTTTESAKSAWSEWEIPNTATIPTKTTAESLQTYKGTTTRAGTQSTTSFYIHLMPAERTCTSTVVETEVIKEYSARTTTDRTKDVTERKTVTEVIKDENGTTETIEMQVVRTTKTTDIGKETVTKTTTTKTTYTRTYTETGEMYVAYFQPSGNGDGDPLQPYMQSDLRPLSSDKISAERLDSVLVRNDDITTGGASCLIDVDNNLIKVDGRDVKINSSGQYVYADDDTVIPDQSSVPAVKTIKSQKTVHDVTTQTTDGTKTTSAPDVDSTTHTDQEFSETKTKTEYIQRTITRNYTFTNVALTKVTWCQRNPNGKPVYTDNVLQTEDFTLSNKLNLYDATDIQKLYLAQCYSKTYPFFVDVQFEQIQ